MNFPFKCLTIFTFLIQPIYANTELTPGRSLSINYDWMDALINKTAAVEGACPLLELDNNQNGFKVARKKSFYGSLGVSGSKWFPHDEIWASVGIAPVVNSFGIYFSEIENLDNMTEERQKKLPQTAKEVEKWKVSDSAYWESQGGVSFYLGAGIFPFEAGIFTIATGGWANYLQKTGPNKVYVEMAKKNIKSISFGVGVSYPNISVEKVKESSAGFAYQFTLDNEESIESFERFMAGDMTKAQELSKDQSSGVVKISQMSEDRIGLSKGWGISLPFIPLLSFKASKENAYDHFEENSVWDEKIVKDIGIYVKQRNTRLLDKKVRESRSFVGGKILTDIPNESEGRNISENLYGNFKYNYQSNWGQETRLRKYIERAKFFTGLSEETCVHIPATKHSLKFNQVILDVKFSDSYMRQIIGLGENGNLIIEKIRSLAKHYQSQNSINELCNDPENSNELSCKFNSESSLEASFEKIEKYALSMKNTYQDKRKDFSRNMSKFGEEIWKSPYIFKAFYEVGKDCGLSLHYEVSGQRVSRHLVNKTFDYNESCLTK